MSSSAPSFFHRFLIINTVITTIFGGLFIYMSGLLGSQYWGIFFGTIALFGLFSFALFFWKSWKYTISDTSFSALKTGFKLSISWMLVWDIFLLGNMFLSYYKQDGMCSTSFNDIPCSLWEYLLHDLESGITLFLLIPFLILLPIIFSITGFYLDRRKNKISFPWSGMILFFGIIVLFFWMNIRL